MSLLDKSRTLFQQIRSNQLLKNAGAFISASFLTRFGDFLFIPLWALFLTTGDYAITGTMYAYRQLMRIVLPLGLGEAIVRQYHDHPEGSEEQKRYVSSVYLFQIFVSLAIIVVVDLWGYPLWEQLTGNVTPFFPFVHMILWISFCDAATDSALALYKTRQQARPYVRIFYAIFFIRILVMVIFVAVFPQGAFGQLFADLFAVGLVFCVVVFSLGREWFTRHFRWSYVREALHFGLPLIPFSAAMWVIDSVDRVLLEQMVSSNELGLYNFGYKVGSAILYFVMGLFHAYTPWYIKLMLSGRESVKKVRRFFLLLTAGLSSITLIGALFVQEILELIMPDRFVSSAQFAIPVLFSGLMLGFYQFFGQPLFFHKKTGYFPFITGMVALVNIGLNLWLIPHFGAIAAAWVTVFSYFLLALITMIISHKLQSVRDVPFVQAFIISLVMLVFILMLPWVETLAVPVLLVKAGMLVMHFGMLLVLIILPNRDNFSLKL